MTGQACNDLLETARSILSSAEASYRDALLRLGGVLHEFVVTFMLQGDQVPAVRRDAFTREKAIRAAADGLRQPMPRISSLIATAMTVPLLSDGGNVGALCWNAIQRFACLVRRRRPDRDIGFRPGRNGLSLAASEEWVVKEEFEGRAQEVFRRAVADGVSNTEAKARAIEVTQSKHAAAAFYQKKRRKETAESVAKVAAVAAPGDIAGMLFEGIRDHPEASVIVAHLSRMVAESKPRRKLSFAS